HQRLRLRIQDLRDTVRTAIVADVLHGVGLDLPFRLREHVSSPRLGFSTSGRVDRQAGVIAKLGSKPITRGVFVCDDNPVARDVAKDLYGRVALSEQAPA